MRDSCLKNIPINGRAPDWDVTTEPIRRNRSGLGVHIRAHVHIVSYQSLMLACAGTPRDENGGGYWTGLCAFFTPTTPLDTGPPLADTGQALRLSICVVCKGLLGGRGIVLLPGCAS